MAWRKAGTTTLGSAGDTCDVTGLSNNKFNMILFHRITSGDTRGKLRLNNDSGSNYALRVNNNGGTDGTTTSSNLWNQQHYQQGNDGFWIGYFFNIASEEKLGIGHLNGRNSTGAGNAPNRSEVVYKWANTSDAISQVNFFNDGSGSYDSGTNATVLGSDGVATTSLNVQDGAIYYDTTLNKEYVLYNNTWTEL